jgi:membrane-bound metal-dependent hydrolase YbcI (DUF457 family)
VPFTPFHLGPALGFGLPFRRYIHVPTFIVANVIVDVEPFLVLSLGLRYPLHGYLHTFLLAFFAGLALGYTMFFIEKFFHTLYKMLLLEKDQKYNLRSFMLAGVLGTELHILLDSPLYGDIQPFFPITINPLYNPALTLVVYSFCVWMGMLGIVFYGYLLVSSAYKRFQKKR